MRKTVLAVAVVVMLFMISAPAFSNELELGLSWTPVRADENYGEENLESMTGFHIGYVMLNFLYGTWDSIVVPPSMISEWTGYYRPGFLNLFDFGIRIQIRPVIASVGMGVNKVRVHEPETAYGMETSFGANLRLGAGLRFDWWGVGLTGTAVFATFDNMVDSLKGLLAESTRQLAFKKIGESLVPSIGVTLYF
jgi:hypothetical protein